MHCRIRHSLRAFGLFCEDLDEKTIDDYKYGFTKYDYSTKQFFGGESSYPVKISNLEESLSDFGRPLGNITPQNKNNDNDIAGIDTCLINSLSDLLEVL